MSFMLDTNMDTQRKYYALLAMMPPEKSLEQGLRLSRMVRDACIAAIQRQYPEYTWEDVRKEYLRRIMTPKEFKTFLGVEARLKAKESAKSPNEAS